MPFWETTLSSKGQVTLPKEMLDAPKLRPGDRLIYSIVGEGIIVTPKNIDFKDLAGLVGDPPNGSATLEEINAAVVAAAGAHAALETDDVSVEDDAA